MSKPVQAKHSEKMQENYFELFGLAQGYALDEAALENAYIALQRAAHPDRVGGDSAARLALVQQAAHINDAYQTLKHPRRRAEYLLSLLGVTVAKDGHTIDDPELLEEVLEQREALAEADSPEAVAQLKAQASAAREACLTALEDYFDAGDILAAHKETLRLTYLEKQLEELRLRQRRT
ncbi:MAG: Fe-S protein assembly co-chaperone HscB [Hyphomicrobiales bacterium]|nr:Fe-S protein assembly co-chaperone HscB [Hyphomicrobiales bacterium]